MAPCCSLGPNAVQWHFEVWCYVTDWITPPLSMAYIWSWRPAKSWALSAALVNLSFCRCLKTSAACRRHSVCLKTSCLGLLLLLKGSFQSMYGVVKWVTEDIL